MSEHSDLFRIRHMLDSALEVQQFTEGQTRVSLDTNVMLVRALMASIGIIGEAASHISTEFREQHPDIPWKQIIGMRNFLIHAYFKIDKDVIWDTATISIPPLVEVLKTMIPTDEE